MLQAKTPVQRRSSDSNPLDSAPAIEHELLREPGHSLGQGIRIFMDSRFGHHFSQVGIHSNASAAESAPPLNARAYALGPNLVFETGQRSPNSYEWEQLPAHELVHAVQQSVARSMAVQGKEKGEDEDEEKKIKRKPVLDFRIVRDKGLPPGSIVGKRQACPAAAPAAQRHRHLDSSAAQIAAMDACTWGVTEPDELGIATETCRDGPNWRLIVTRVNSVIRSHSRLLPGQAEPVPDVNTTAGNFCDQVTELDNLGSCLGAWYMIRAVRAHEDVHVDEWRDNFTTDWNPLEAAIEALTVPAAGATADRGAATAALRGTAVFNNARDTTSAGGNFPTFWAIPDPNANTDAAERAVVEPTIRWICKYAGWRGWNPGHCAVCAAQGIT